MVYARCPHLLPLALLIVCFSAASPRAKGDEAKDSRAPAPEGANLAEAEKTVKEVFAAEYRATDARARDALAKRLMEAAAKEEGIADKFVLLRDAREISLSVGDWPLVIRATVEWANAYQLDELSLFTELLSSKLPSDPGNRKSLVQACLDTTRRADSAKRDIPAIKFAGAAEEAFTRAKLTDGARQLGELRQGLILQKQIIDDYNTALETLKDKPSDPTANLAAGRYVCFYAEDWTNGLQNLAAGSDATLKALAARDLAYPRMPEEEADLAGAWWDFAAGQTGVVRSGGRARAGYWYRHAQSGLTGLAQTLAERRIEDSMIDYWSAAALRRRSSETRNGRTVVFICDASQSMPQMKRQRFELMQAVAGIREVQRFNVIFFKDGQTIQFQPDMVGGSPEMRTECFAFLNKMTPGKTNAGGMDAALTEAFAEKPQLIYVLSAFAFDRATETVGVIRKLNATHQTRLNAICFGEGQPSVDLAKRIAAENGGKYRSVGENDIR